MGLLFCCKSTQLQWPPFLRSLSDIFQGRGFCVKSIHIKRAEDVNTIVIILLQPVPRAMMERAWCLEDLLLFQRDEGIYALEKSGGHSIH